MRGLRFHEFGSFHNLLVEDLPDPRLAEGEVLVRICAASLNPSDAKNVLGHMEGTTLPRVPGHDFAGVVVDGAAELVGMEVWGTGGEVGFTRDGTHAEMIVVPRDGVSPKPQSLTMEQAAAVGVNFVTAWLGLNEGVNLQAGETVLVTGAGGGVGSAATQIAKWKGARTLGVDRKPIPEDVAKQYGIDEAIAADPPGIILLLTLQ